MKKTSKDEIKVTFPDPQAGTYSVSCEIASKKGGGVTKHSSGDSGGFGWVSVVDSQGIAIQRAWTEETDDGHIQVCTSIGRNNKHQYAILGFLESVGK